jgi:hypothetical protein
MSMTADQAFKIPHVEKRLVDAARPTALRAKLMEIERLLQRDVSMVNDAAPTGKPLERCAATSPQRAPQEIPSPAERPAFRQEDLERIAGGLGLGHGDVVILDCLLNKGFSLSDFQRYSSLMCGIFDCPAEQARELGRVGELASRYASCLGIEPESRQGRAGARSRRKTSA